LVLKKAVLPLVHVLQFFTGGIEAYMNLCNTFKKLACETWNMLKKAKELSCPYGEETITDVNLHQLIMYQNEYPTESSGLKIKIWNKIQEGHHGGDWEWWFTGTSKQWFGIRIQAKILNHSDNFEHLHYRTKKIFQRNRLIQKCREEGLMPLYCLYCYWEKDMMSYPVSWKCEKHEGIEEFGCSLIDAYKICEIYPKKHLTDVLENMIPWHCLFCCDEFAKGDLPNRVRSVLINFAGTTHNRNSVIFQLHQSPPDYVKEIMNNEKPEINDRYLKGITIIAEECEF
jgi:hypothetical protein